MAPCIVLAILVVLLVIVVIFIVHPALVTPAKVAKTVSDATTAKKKDDDKKSKFVAHNDKDLKFVIHDLEHDMDCVIHNLYELTHISEKFLRKDEIENLHMVIVALKFQRSHLRNLPTDCRLKHHLLMFNDLCEGYDKLMESYKEIKDAQLKLHTALTFKPELADDLKFKKALKLVNEVEHSMCSILTCVQGIKHSIDIVNYRCGGPHSIHHW